MSSEVCLVLSCRVCRKEIGEVSEDELKHLVIENEFGPICFDCDPAYAAFVPDIFLDRHEGDLVDIGDTGFQMRDGKLKVIGESRARVSERERERILSSYTYLNKPNEKRLVTGDLIEYEMCEQCSGHSVSWSASWGGACPGCDGQGIVEIAYYLPNWLVGLARSYD